MNLKPILVCILFLASVTMVSGWVYTDQFQYFSFENDSIIGTTVQDMTNNTDGTLNNVEWGVTGKLGDAIAVDGATDHVDLLFPRFKYAGSISYMHQPRTINFWVKPNEMTGGTQTLFRAETSSGSKIRWIRLYMKNDGEIEYQTHMETKVEYPGINSSDKLNTTSWAMITLTHNIADTEMFINGVSQGNCTFVRYGTDNFIDDFQIGYSDSDNNFTIDEFLVYNTTLNASEISQLFNSSNGYTPYPAGTTFYSNRTIELNILDNSSNSILNANCVFNGISFYSNEKNIEYWHNLTNELNCTLLGYQDLTHTVTSASPELNLTMYRSRLMLNFSRSTDGVIIDQHSHRSFSTSNLVIVQNNLSVGNVYVKFNQQGVFGNNTQFYEYYNDQKTAVQEEISLFHFWNLILKKVWFKVTTLGGSALDDVTVRVYGNMTSSYTSRLSFNNELVGQRLTNDDGQTFFYFPKYNVMKVVVSKDGYAPESRILTSSELGDYTTKDESYLIKLRESEDSYLGTFIVLYDSKFDNKTQTISGNIYSPSATTIQYSTSHKATLTTLTGDSFDRYPFTLNNNDHFLNTSMSDLTINFYVDGIFWGSRVVKYEPVTKHSIISLPTLNNNTVKALFPLFVMMLALLAQSVIASNNVGFDTFMVLGIIAPFISTSFIPLSIICVLYYLLKSIRGLTTAG